MTGLKSKLKQLTSEKSEISKIRRKGENEYKKIRTLSRKYSSSLKSTQKRIETFKQNADDINEALSQKITQMESIQRLKSAAEERLGLEIQNKEQVENEIDFAGTSEEKQNLEYRLNSIISTIDNIKNEIKQRSSMEKKFALAISEVITFKDALKIIKVRANEMAKVGKTQKGGMAAIMNATKKKL